MYWSYSKNRCSPHWIGWIIVVNCDHAKYSVLLLSLSVHFLLSCLNFNYFTSITHPGILRLHFAGSAQELEYLALDLCGHHQTVDSKFGQQVLSARTCNFWLLALVKNWILLFRGVIETGVDVNCGSSFLTVENTPRQSSKFDLWK